MNNFSLTQARSLIPLAGLAFAVFLCLPGKFAEAEETWEIVLRQQLTDEKQCDLNYMTNVREYDLAGDKVLEGRVHCMDGRQFDFTRAKLHQKFDIRTCAPTLC